MNQFKNLKIDDRSPSHAGIVAGICKGDLWLNNENNPTLAVSYSYCVGGCGIMGEIARDSEEETLAFFEKVFNDLKKKGINEFEFSVEDEKLSKQILSLFHNRQMESEEELSYRRSKLIPVTKELPQGYIMYRVDDEFLNNLPNLELQNKEMLTERMDNSWNGYKAYLMYSKASIVVYNSMIVGIIFGSAHYKNVVSIDIEVCEAHRHKGLASRLTETFVNDCVNNGLIAQWDHTASNQASRILAERNGFTIFKKRPYYWFSI